MEKEEYGKVQLECLFFLCCRNCAPDFAVCAEMKYCKNKTNVHCSVAT
jgi:hypothetical protein